MNQSISFFSYPNKKLKDLLLASYSQGERNFQGWQLQNLNFRGQNLSGADFRRASLQGTDFTEANLAYVRFQQAQMGGSKAGKLMAQGVAVFWGLLAGLLSTRIASPFFEVAFIIQCSAWLTLVILIFYAIAITRFGLGKGFIYTISGMALLGTIAGVASILLDEIVIGYVALECVNQSVFLAVVIAFLCIASAPILALAKREAQKLSLVFGLIAALSVPFMASGVIASLLASPQAIALLLVIALSLVLFCLNWGQRVLNGNPREHFARNLAVVVAARCSTCFCRSNLEHANFSEAQLAYSDLRARTLDYTRWDWAKGMEQVLWDSGPLRDERIRQLLYQRNCTGGQKLDLSGSDLTGMDLSQIDFNQVNFKGANLVRANLSGANLTQANLALIKALGTDFSKVKLTGACLEGWAIDCTTNLDWVDCGFIYRLEHAKLGGRRRDRQPASGNFGPGEFTQLFRVVVNTVEFIFRNGLDKEALAVALKQTQADFDPRIQLQGVEHRGDGFFKVALEVPDDVSPSSIHQNFKNAYHTYLQQLETRYQAQLQAAQQEIEHHRRTTTELTALLHQFAQARPSNLTSPAPVKEAVRRITLTFWDGSLEQGYPVTADLQVDSTVESVKLHASLPPAPELIIAYQQWRSLYQAIYSLGSRIQFEDSDEVTNISHQELDFVARNLAEVLTKWLQSSSFRLIADKLRENFLPQQPLQIHIQTEDLWLQRMPWHLWSFLQDFPKAVIALGGMSLESLVPSWREQEKTRILAVFGNSSGIDIQIDRQLLQDLESESAEVCCLIEPSRKSFNEALWDAKGWDLFCFSGHSLSHPDGQDGMIQINSYDPITASDLRFGLQKAVEQGLQLAVLNSCDGLGLASLLSRLKLPQAVVMKELVPDLVAQQFLEYFLRALICQPIVSLALRDAQQQLSGIEDQYPYASWLPTLFQSTTNIPVLKIVKDNKDSSS